MDHPYKLALDIQNGCNVNSVVGALARSLPAINANAKAREESIRTDPAVVMLVNKLVNLVPASGSPFPVEGYSEAHQACLERSMQPMCAFCGLVGPREELEAHLARVHDRVAV